MTASSEYKVHILSAAGVLRSVVVDFDNLHLIRQVNRIGELIVTLRGDHPAVAGLEHKSLVELWRRDRDHALDWTCEARYLYLYYSHSTQETGHIELRCVDPLWLLSTRIVAWDVNIVDRTIFNRPAGNICELLVKYNATGFATVAAGRLCAGVIPNLTHRDTVIVATSYGWECSGQNLLASLQQLAPLGPGDLDMYYGGGSAWEFRWCQGQLGADRSASIQFSLELANLADPRYTLDRRHEKTVAVIGGQVVRGVRAYRIRYGPDYLAGFTPIPNDAEVWVPAPGVIDPASMDAAADAALEANRKIDRLDFNLVQTPAYFYGLDYFLGDKVTTVYEGVTRVQEIKKVVIAAAPTGENTLVVSCG